MIIYPAVVTLAGVPLDKCRIGYQTWTRDAVPADVTASSETGDFPKDAPLRPDTFEFWQPTALPATWVLEFNDTQSIDYVGIAAHNLGTQGCTIRAETQVGGDPYDQIALDATPEDNAPIMFIDEARPADRVKITIEGSGDAPMIGVIYVGAVLAMQKSVSAPFKPITMARDTVLQNSMSRGGQFLGQDYRRNGVMGTIAFKHLSAAWVRENFEPFSKEARRYPYFIAWNPLEYPDEVGYCWTDDDITAGYEGLADLMEVNWKMRGIGAE